jgi:peptidoglycan hydrolase CwlO-like protein
MTMTHPLAADAAQALQGVTDLIAQLFVLTAAARNPQIVADPLEVAGHKAAAALTALSEQNTAIAAQVAELTRDVNRLNMRACNAERMLTAAEAKVARYERAFRQLKENATGQWVPSSVVGAIVDAALTEGTPE